MILGRVAGGDRGGAGDLRSSLETLLPGRVLGDAVAQLGLRAHAAVSGFQPEPWRLGSPCSRAAGFVATQTHRPEPWTEAAAGPAATTWKNASAASCPRVAACASALCVERAPSQGPRGGTGLSLRAWRLLPQDSPPRLGPRIDCRTSRPDLLRTAWLQVQSSGHWRAELTRPMWAQPHGSAAPVPQFIQEEPCPGCGPCLPGHLDAEMQLVGVPHSWPWACSP